jgi:tetratricopeptide (TPR) repeat protein
MLDAERVFVEFQSKGDHDSAVRTLENVLRSEQKFVQQLRDSVLSSLFERLAVGYNTLGMKYLRDGKVEVSLNYFEKAVSLTEPSNLHMTPESRLVLRAVTYNNLGCFYKSMNKLHTALSFLKKAQGLEENAHPACQNPAGTHLNLCALLSQMGKHERALEHVTKALELLQNETGESQGESLRCVAYFNMGAELEHLRKPQEATYAYEKAKEHCLSELGDEHPLSRQITTCLTQLRKQQMKKNSNSNSKQG